MTQHIPRPAFLRHDCVSEDGCRIAWWSAGNPDGFPVVLLHGFALDHTVWAPLYAQAALLERCRLVMPDLRGHGASDRMPTAAHYTSGDAWAADLDAVIRASGVVRPTVVAWSFGGRSVLDHARRYGTDGLHGIQFVAAASLAHFASAGPDHVVLDALCAEDKATVADATARFIGDVLGVPRDSADFAALTAVAARCPVEHRRWMRQRGLDYDALIGGLDLPLMWVNGAHDSIVLPSRADVFRALLPDTRTSIHAGARHAPFRDDPARFTRELLDFITDPPPCRRTARAVARQG
ncbi:MAG: alpha/beta hydrolase [Methyloversatilis discipulorum]|uniref:alpha/beta fold hydrolase n=1 Tax=Methyloversatilis discipulorum TaxID=1119528 RepID=UPI0026F36B69|nr:alpha/beta hydrolase [Methyloversatilis discipulorum]MBV5286109.1 alpha/beta hydrolase [Methyloversatilis discipulorum]